MTVIRVKHNKENPYVLLNKEVLEHPKLTLKAKGLWAFCMAKPDDWEFHLVQLQKTLVEGRVALSRAIDELIKYGYCIRIQNKDTQGRWTTVDYEIYETCKLKKCLPEACFVRAENPLAENVHLLSNDKELNKDNSNISKKPPRTARQPAATPISLSQDSKRFEGISLEDMQRWRNTFPAVNLDKELSECLLWALSTPRKNYRKSIDTWLRNVQKTHTTAFKEEIRQKEAVDLKDINENKNLAKIWESKLPNEYRIHYSIDIRNNEVEFIMPGNASYAVNFNNSIEEFKNLCQKALIRMKILE